MNAQFSIKDMAQQVHCDVVDKNATVTSLQVAEHFDKRHDHVLRDIAQLAEEVASWMRPTLGWCSSMRLTGMSAVGPSPCFD
jgi:hypothetical protein